MLSKRIMPRTLGALLLGAAVIAVAACSRPTPATGGGGGVDSGGADLGGAGETAVTVEPNPIYGDYTTPIPTEEGLPYPPLPTDEPVMDGYPAPAESGGDASSPDEGAAAADATATATGGG